MKSGTGGKQEAKAKQENETGKDDPICNDYNSSSRNVDSRQNKEAAEFFQYQSSKNVKNGSWTGWKQDSVAYLISPKDLQKSTQLKEE